MLGAASGNSRRGRLAWPWSTVNSFFIPCTTRGVRLREVARAGHRAQGSGEPAGVSMVHRPLARPAQAQEVVGSAGLLLVLDRQPRGPRRPAHGLGRARVAADVAPA